VIEAFAFVEDLDAPELAPADRHHLDRVLRLRPGAEIVVGDGAGRWRRARFGDPITVDGDVVVEDRPRPVLTVAFAVIKGDRPEWVVQKLTELGIDTIAPFVAERSVVRWEAPRAARQLERFRAVARGAAMQCRRAWLPSVSPVTGFDAVAALPGAVLAERGGAALGPDHHVVLVGPEGGWSPDERSRGLPAVRLGDHVLRAETAAIAAGVLLAAIRAGRYGPA